MTDKNLRGLRLELTLLLGFALIVVSCTDRKQVAAGSTPQPQQSATPTDVWLGLLSKTPHPHTTALPAAVWSPVDGTYAKVDPNPPQWWACRRCADYRPAGGPWKLNLDRGIMRIFYEIPSWTSIASFEVSDDRLFLFNDVTCPTEVGEYSWQMEDRNLVLGVIHDPCAFGLRAENLVRQPWGSCIPPNEESEGDLRHKPLGCEPDPSPEPMLRSDENGITALVHGAIAHHYQIPPEVIVAANPAVQPPLGEIELVASPDSIAYGQNIVLWKAGDWVEASTELPYSAMGVQILGAHTIGWASVFFDDVEVWRGDTAEIWSHHGRHGGYIEISGFEPGFHTLRIETLAIDHRPVTVGFFGFGEVKPGD